MLFTRGRFTKYVYIAPKGLEKVQSHDPEVQPRLHKNEAYSMVSPPKRPRDGAFGIYFNTQRNDTLFTTGRHTKYVYYSHQRTRKGANAGNNKM